MGIALPNLFRLVPDYFVQIFFADTIANLASYFSTQENHTLSTHLYHLFLQFLVSSGPLVAFQLAIAMWIAWRLHEDLARRNFPFTRGLR